ncbi:MAG: chemotaxis protein CheB [Anaerolineae bacterium]|nr:chemotaxis protein CheB [Anaerolineae bacterium]
MLGGEPPHPGSAPLSRGSGPLHPGGRFQAVVVGGSAGGGAALQQILPALPAGYPLPIVVVQHLHPLQQAPAILHACSACKLPLQEANEKEVIQPGIVYYAPANYHLLIEEDRTFSLSIDARVHFARPAIDVLFESAADAYRRDLIGVILSGANEDGAHGLRRVKARGGLAVVQDPAGAQVEIMPRAAMHATQVDYVLSPPDIGRLLAELGSVRGARAGP